MTPTATTPGPERREGCADYAGRALGQALGRFGGGGPECGERHEATFEHPVLSSTVNAGSYDPRAFAMEAGPSYRQVDRADPEASRYVHPMGQSGNPLSGNFDDLLSRWREGRYLPMRSEGYEIEHELTLEPGG